MIVKKNNGIGKFLAGAAVGAGLGILFAPKSGKETREDIKKKIAEILEQVKTLKAEDIKEMIVEKVNDLQEQLKDLDKEKVLKIAKKKAKQIQDATEELVNYAVEKGTPMLEKTANSIREAAIKTTKDVLARLEGEEK